MFFSDNHDIISVRTYELDTPEGVSKVKIFSIYFWKFKQLNLPAEIDVWKLV